MAQLLPLSLRLSAEPLQPSLSLLLHLGGLYLLSHCFSHYLSHLTIVNSRNTDQPVNQRFTLMLRFLQQQKPCSVNITADPTSVHLPIRPSTLPLLTNKIFSSKICCLALAEKIWEVFHGHKPHTQLCCLTHKCIFLTNGLPFKRKQTGFTMV